MMLDLNLTFRKAFTLIEVNLAIFIMAGGVLAMISLYSLGFRESRQSREDVAAAAFADAVLNPLVVALSSTNITWGAWKGMAFKAVSEGVESGEGGGEVYVMPHNGNKKEGWYAYFETRGTGASTFYKVLPNPETKASDVYRKLMNGGDTSMLPGSASSPPTPPDGMTYALVASRDSEFSPIITLAVRCVRKNLLNTLMAQPVFSTEVHFQGDPNK